MTENSLRKVKMTDLHYLKTVIETTFDWYIRNCTEITDLAEYFSEEDEETMLSILSTGLRTLQERREMMEEGNMKRGDQL